MQADGRLRWTAPRGDWTILRFGHTATGARNISAPDAGLGLECDKFSTAALDFHFDQYFAKVLSAMERLGKRDLAGAVIDSRSDESRVGKECVSTCRSRWSQHH